MTTSLVTSSPEAMPWTVRDVAKAILLAVAISVLAVGFSLVAASSFGGSQSGWILAAAFGSEAALFGTSWYFGVFKYRLSWGQLGLRPFRWVGLVLAVAVMVAGLIFEVIYVSIIAQAGWQSLLPPPLPPIFSQPGAVGVLGCVLAVVVTPLAEEAFFRGLIFGVLRDRQGVGVGTVVSALIFAGVHFEIGVLIPIFFLGLLLAVLYHKTQSIVPGILVHMGYNALALCISNSLAPGVSTV